MSRLAISTQRRLATGVFLLASFLQICGCNPDTSCEALRLTPLAAIPPAALLEQCAPCLTQREMSELRSAVSGSFGTGSRFLKDGQTVGNALAGMGGPTFTPYGEVSATFSSRQARANGASMDRTTGPGAQDAGLIAWPIPESVLFLYDHKPDHNGSARRLGTGFIVSARETQQTESSQFLVTARHLVDPQWAHCDATNPASVTVRFNRLGGGVGYSTLGLNVGSNRSFFIPDDDQTDIALLPLTAETVREIRQYSLKDLDFDRLPTAKELAGLDSEQRIVTAGVSLWPASTLMDFPVSSAGLMKTAASPLPVRAECAPQLPAKPVQVWMIHAAFSEGVAGAPVYAAIPRGPSQVSTPVLVGIQSVVWPARGLAGMTPVTALEDLVRAAIHRHPRILLAEVGKPVP